MPFDLVQGIFSIIGACMFFNIVYEDAGGKISEYTTYVRR